MTCPDVLYRVQDNVDSDGVSIYWCIFHVLRETPCGYWVQEMYGSFAVGDPVWMSKVARKRRAWPTMEEALDSYYRRKRKQTAIMEHRWKAARQSRDWAREERIRVRGNDAQVKDSGFYKRLSIERNPFTEESWL